MRVLFSIFPATAHLYPVVPLAHTLQAMGHDVCVAAAPDMADEITAVGLKAVPVGRTADLGAVLPEVAGDDRLERLAARLGVDATDPQVRKAVRYRLISTIALGHGPEPGTPPALDDLMDFARAWSPDLVLWDPMCFGAALAARACGAAQARVLWGLDHFAWFAEETAALLGAAEGPDPALALDAMAGALRRLGRPQDHELITGQWSVDLMPQRMRLPSALRYVPLRRVPYNGPGVVPQWLMHKPQRPRVCLTMGLSLRKYFKDDEELITGLLAAVSALDVEVVATVTAEQFDASYTLPDNVRAIDYVPLDLVLPDCAAIVHHGGTSTFAAAAAHGVPQLIMPSTMGDHLALARYVAGAGGGLFTERSEATPERIAAQLARILEEPSFQRGAAEIHRDMLSAPGPAEVVPVLERLTAEFRG
ncbi:nucleotide disphospho-sugar-binding domain-containing protein [Streptomyces sp. NPDC006235]|uniref:nucleotide disphospho-sugar-binding domain-containing protein n=1 Tax=Streptomyces sp. NPDC006235 TaxID=3156736 RepID=UPI0033B2E491